jgi:hypothetical protein
MTTTNTDELEKAVERLQWLYYQGLPIEKAPMNIILTALPSLQARLAAAEGRLEKMRNASKQLFEGKHEQNAWGITITIYGPTFLEAIDSIPTTNRNE